MPDPEQLTELEKLSVVKNEIVTLHDVAVSHFRRSVAGSNVTAVAIEIAEKGMLGEERVPIKVQADMIKFLLSRVVPNPKEITIRDNASGAAAWITAEGR